MISFDFQGTDVQVTASLRTRSTNIMSTLADRMTSLMKKLEDRIKDTYLSGGVLNIQSGLLREGVKSFPAEIEGEQVIGRVVSETPYGKIHEEGGTRMYVINPAYTTSESRRIGRGTLQLYKVLRFELGGSEVFSRYVFHPPLPKRAFMAPALEEMRNEIIEGLKDAVMRAVIE